MKSVPLELGVAVVLLSVSPDFLIIAMNARLSALISKNPVIVRVLATSLLCLLDISVFGFPQKIFGPVLLAGGFAFLAICTGVLYYFIEDWRLGIVRRGAMRITKRVSLTDSESSLMLSLLLLAAISEEVLFRWYVLLIPLTYGLLPLFACILISSGAFALSHQKLGSDVMISRGLFGALLTLPVLFWGNLLFPIIAHMVYNALVHLRPVRYIQIKKEI